MSNTFMDDLKKYKRGNVLFVEGEPSTFLYIIKTGKVLLVKQEGNSLVPLTEVKSGNFIGEISVFTDETRTATAIVMDDSEIYLVKKSDIKQVVSQCPEWIDDIMQTLCERLKHTTDILREHKIMLSESESTLTSDQINHYMKAIDDYRAGRGRN